MEALLEIVSSVDVVSSALTFLLGFFGGKIATGLKFAKEAAEVVEVTVEAAEDGKVTAEELEAIKKEVDEAIEVLKKKE